MWAVVIDVDAAHVACAPDAAADASAAAAVDASVAAAADASAAVQASAAAADASAAVEASAAAAADASARKGRVDVPQLPLEPPEPGYRLVPWY